MGWLPILTRWAGKTREVVGTDMNDKMLAAATALRDEESITNVTIVRDDVFDSTLPWASVDLVHLRFQLAPLGSAMKQVSTARPGEATWVAVLSPG